MKKTIYIKDENYNALRNKILGRLKNHREAKYLGRSNQDYYDVFADYIKNELKILLKTFVHEGKYEFRLRKNPISEVTAYKLWQIIYQTSKYPQKRKATSRVAIELFILFAFESIPPDLLEEEAPPPQENNIDKPIKSAYNSTLNLDAYLGDWYLYCNKGERNRESYNLRFMEQGLIAENILRIEKDIIAGLKVTFISNEGTRFEGGANIFRTNPSYLEIRLNRHNMDALIFLFHIGSGIKDDLIGIYNHIYIKKPSLGTGLSIMVKCPKEEVIEDLGKWKPRKTEHIQHEEVKKVLRYLAFPMGARIEAIQDFGQLRMIERFDNPFPFRGVYKTYAYMGRTDATYIVEAILKIDEYQKVQHRKGGVQNLGGVGRAEGKAELIKGNCMLVSLKSKENSRLGFFIIRTSEGEVMPKVESLYTGIFCGNGLSNSMLPIGSRVILEYLGKDMTLFEQTELKRYKVGSAEINELPAGIQENLTGRTHNIIGFFRQTGYLKSNTLLREAEEEIEMKNVFFDSACQRALSNDFNEIRNAAKMFERAVYHGYEPISAFKDKLNEYLAEGLIKGSMRDGILKNEIYTKLMKSFK